MIADLLALIFGGAYLGAEAVKEKRAPALYDKWAAKQGYNYSRQLELELKLCSTKGYNELLEITGLPKYTPRREIIRKALEKEGYRYQDIHESSRAWAREHPWAVNKRKW